MIRLVLLTTLLALLVPSAARAEIVLVEGTPQVARIHMNAASTTATAGVLRVVEIIDGADVDVPVAPTNNGIEASEAWNCRSPRTFVATDGVERSLPLTVSTPACEDRVKVTTLRDLDLGDDLRVTLVDRWHQGGLEAEVCIVPPGLKERCRHVVMPAGGYVSHLLFRAFKPGAWRVVAITRDGRVQRRLTVIDRHRSQGTRVLFTGDSMMLASQHVLRNRLPRAVQTIDDIYVGSGITRPFVVDWSKLPRRQVRTYRPDATIISLGMGDSRGIDDAPCCGDAWIAAYAKRDRAIMRTYTQRGAGAVVWLNLPLGENPIFWPSQAAVNVAIAKAALGLEHVQVVDLTSIFTPDGAFHRFLDVDGRRVRVRTDDGIHLTRAGARIASVDVLERLRTLGIIDA